MKALSQRTSERRHADEGQHLLRHTESIVQEILKQVQDDVKCRITQSRHADEGQHLPDNIAIHCTGDPETSSG